MPEETKKPEEPKALHEKVQQAYSNAQGEVDEKEARHAICTIECINKDLEAREKATLVFNGLSYSQSYLYNQRKAINYSPPREPGKDREVSMGLVHEKIIGFAAFFLKYVYKRRIKCYDDKGVVIRNAGEVYDLGIEHSYRLERFKQKIALIYWELFSQGDAFILDDWDVRNVPQRVAYKEGVKVDANTMDFTYEFLDGLTYEDGEMIQVRKAVSRIMDGREVILGNPEVEDLQEQPRITLERIISRADAEKIYGSLKRWKQVPNEKTWITNITGEGKSSLFETARLADPGKDCIEHRHFDKENNRFNIFLNGIMLLPRDTTFTLFFPRGNYPLTKASGERLTGSAYSRSIPAKTKFNADFVDWSLRKLAEKFEQGVDPALLVKGRFTLPKDIFRGGQRTHGITKDNYELANPDLNGIQNQDVTFVKLLKEIVESQTVNSTTTGEVADTATATAVNAAQMNQVEKLGYLLDSVVNAFGDMALRRAETIESKYTIKQKETIVDGKKISVYQDFTVSMDGTEHTVEFDEEVGSPTYDYKAKQDELFKKSFTEKKNGNPTSYHIINPNDMRSLRWTIDAEIVPERIKDSSLQMINLQNEFKFLRETFGNMLNMEAMKDEYLGVTNRPPELFLPAETMKLNQMLNMEMNAEGNGGTPTGSMGRPTVSTASRDEAMNRR